MKQNETGRSMVEMLGVIAIMGVLTVGGVAGYRYAVDKMDANEIVDELIKRAVTASQQRVLGRTINLSEYGNNGAINGVYGVAPTDNYDGNATQFALSVQDVPQRVCDMILDSNWALPREIIVGGIVVTEDTSCAEGNNDMTFAFNNTLESGDVGNGDNSGGNSGEGGTADPCADFEPTVCRTGCTNNNGEAQYTYAEVGTPCADDYDPDVFWPDNPKSYAKACDGAGVCFDCPNPGGDNAVYNYTAVASKVATGPATNVEGCSCHNGGWVWKGTYCEYIAAGGSGA